MSGNREEWLRRAIADALERHLRPLLPRDWRYRLTLIATTDDTRDGGIMVSEDETARVLAELQGIVPPPAAPEVGPN